MLSQLRATRENNASTSRSVVYPFNHILHNPCLHKITWHKRKPKTLSKIIDGDPSVGESSGGLVGVEIFSVRKVIGARAKVPRKLLVPQSTEESPMTNSAGAKGT